MRLAICCLLVMAGGLLTSLFSAVGVVGAARVTPSKKSYDDNEAAKRTGRKVLIVSLDGFKSNYIDTYRLELGNLTRIAKHVRAAYTIPVFPTFTFPNHYSIATGVYPEVHGIVHNTFLVPEIHSQFVKSRTDEVYWNHSEPIWITATKQNVPSGVFLWPGSQTKMGGLTPRYYEPVYSDGIPWTKRVDDVVRWLADYDVNLAMLYSHEPDKTSHVHGPESDAVFRVLQQVNDNIGYLLKMMESRGLINSVDLIICSDHGLTRVNVSKIVILSELMEHRNVDNYFDPELRVETWANGAIIHLWPRVEKILALYHLLKGKSEHFDFYLREEIPEYWHYRNSSRIPPILGVGKLGWRAVWYRDDLNLPKIYGSLGAHGYDNRYADMRGTFLAMGPSFKRGTILEPFETHNIYSLIAELAGIKPRPNNGSLVPFLKALRYRPQNLSPADERIVSLAQGGRATPQPGPWKSQTSSATSFSHCNFVVVVVASICLPVVFADKVLVLLL